MSPALAGGELEQRRSFLQVGRNRHRAGDHVEQDVPLRSQQQQQDAIPRPSPPPMRISTSSTMGNSAVAGTEAAICASGCAMRASLGLKPMATPTGIVHSAPMSSAIDHAAEGCRCAFQDLAEVVGVQLRSACRSRAPSHRRPPARPARRWCARPKLSMPPAEPLPGRDR